MLFAEIDLETTVQENDKTRLDVSRSYGSAGDTITKLEVKPTIGGTFADVTALGYLDWQFTFKFDIAAGTTVDFNEGAGVLTTAALTTGERTLAQVAADLKTKLDAAGALVYTVAVTADDEFVISATGAFSIGSAAFWSKVGFTAGPYTGATSYTGEEVRRITRTVELEINDATNATKTIDVISERADKLFSTDDRLRKHESDVMKYLTDGRSTFKDIHRRAQGLVLEWLDLEGFTDSFGNKYTVDAFTDVGEVSEWATMIALRLIFESVRSAVDDVFDAKARRYEGLEARYRNRAILRIDTNNDGTTDVPVESVDIRTCRVRRG